MILQVTSDQESKETTPCHPPARRTASPFILSPVVLAASDHITLLAYSELVVI